MIEQALRVCFNSILVRLKGTSLKRINAIKGQFQFHTGSIKSLSFADAKASTSSGFNSILVRLKVHHITSTHFEKEFQFHTGSIKSPTDTIYLAPVCRFNSILVRLKA